MNITWHRLLWRLGWSGRGSHERAAVYPGLVVCEECDAVYNRQPLAAGEQARCSRCGATLGAGHRIDADGQLALAVASLICFVMGNLGDIVTLDLRGVRASATLFEAIAETWANGERAVALLAGATAIGFPLLVILLRLWVLVPLARGRRAPSFIAAMRALRWVQRWSMVEVFLLGTLIAIVRSAGLAAVVPGLGIFSYAALTVLLTVNQAAGLHGLWRRADQLPAAAST
ncbi:MAG: paraquat-inducible protein A [Burkholderiaceae bacterium]|nr:paraquat-inducible protein A [Burkholderiaceae bacterium]